MQNSEEIDIEGLIPPHLFDDKVSKVQEKLQHKEVWILILGIKI